MIKNIDGLHIGSVIKSQIKRKSIKIKVVCESLGMNRGNLYDIYKRRSVDSLLLHKLSAALDFDFFVFYGHHTALDDLNEELNSAYRVNKILLDQIDHLNAEIISLKKAKV